MRKIRTSIIAVIGLLLFLQPLYSVFANENKEDNILEETVEEIEINNADVEENIEVEEERLGDIHVLLSRSGEIVPVGSTAQFQLYFTSEGAREFYENVDVVINLPSNINDESILFEQDLNELKILNVVPQYDNVNKKLLYHFDILSGGMETSIPIKIKTINGEALNEVNLSLSVSVYEAGVELKSVSESIQLSAASNMSLTNILEGIMIDDVFVQKSSVRYEDQAVFGVGASILKLENGTLKPKASNQITLTYVLAEGFTYVSNTSGLEPIIDGQTLTWTLNSNQNEDDEYYFNTNFKVHAVLDDAIVPFTTVSNEVVLSAEFIDGSVQDINAVTKYIVTPNYEKEEAASFPDGAYATQFSSPKDSFGGSSGSQNNDIEVYPGALLGWNIYLTSLTMTTPDYKNNSYDFFVYPDKNSEIVQFYSGDFFFRPNTSYKDAGYLPLEEQPYYSISAKYTDNDDWDRLIPIVTPSKMYTAEELGIDSDRELEYLWMHFHDGENRMFTDYLGYRDQWQHLPQGMSASNVRLYTTSKEGYIGKLENKFGVSFSGWNADGYLVQSDSENVPEDLKDVHGPLSQGFENFISNKTVRVVQPPEGPTRYVKANTYFSKSSKNMIQTGINTLNFAIGNDMSSLEKLEGPFHAYALLDEGIEIVNPEEALGGALTVIDENFKNTGKTLVKLVFNKESITINRQITMQVEVLLKDTMAYKTGVQLIGFLEKDFEVAKATNANGTITLEDIDIHDLNQNGDFNEKVFMIKNEYTYKDAYEYVGMLLSGMDETYMTITQDAMFSTYINLYNNLESPIKNLDLVYVLPRENDTYVLSNETRDSEFDTYLSRAVILPEEYEDIFEVYYSTSGEPKLKGVLDANTEAGKQVLPDDLIEEDQQWLLAEEVSNFKEIKSIRIIKKENTKSLKDSEIKIGVSLVNDMEASIGSKSYGSFAFAINDSSVIESQDLTIEIKDYPAPTQYMITGDDVMYTVEDAQELQENGTLLKDVLSRANVKTFIDEEQIEEEVNVRAVIVDEPSPIIEGEYAVNLEWIGIHETRAEIVFASTTIKMTVVDVEKPNTKPDEEKPEEPEKPDDQEKPVEKETPSTSVEVNKALMIIILIGGLSVLVLSRRKKFKSDEK